jgi:alkylhydroperoxidase family enzyme
MSHIAPLSREAITDPEMIELIAQSEKLGIPDDLFPRIIARAPEQAKPLMRALLQSHAQGNVDHRLKEIIRILLARFANDKYFSALRSRKAQDMGLTEARIDAGCYEYESDASFTEAEKWALRYADQMFLDATLSLRHADVYAVNWSGSAKESRIGEHAMALLPVSAFGT